MRIKQIKMYGFKSFADKTTINFEEDFIGIVGPNGSGKSNIIDAIRWVFGERSHKTLRGDSSTDNIFGGTEKRKKLNFAEVTIVLDNTDRHLELEFDEVGITRRLYRSGNSEYLINNSEVRLKDIEELIMDKGIGKSAFSIISQGKVDEIVTTNSESRRTIIEEVAGILKYKTRKDRTNKKLERTEENLNQVNIMLSEMQTRLAPLEKQAKVAKEFKVLREDLTKKEISLAGNIVHHYNEDLVGIKKINEDISIKKIEIENNILKLEETETETSAELNVLNQELREINTKYNSINENIVGKRSDLKILKERQQLNLGIDTRVVDLQNKVHNLEEELESTKQQLLILSPTKESLDNSKNSIQEELATKRNELYSLTQQKNDIDAELAKQVMPYATRKILDSKINGIVGTVSSLFEVDNKYSTAISIAIGARINDVIMDNKDSSKRAIDYLKENKIGRQTFLPKDSMRPLFIDDSVFKKLNSFAGFIGCAFDLIDIELANERVFKNILGNIIIAKDMNSAIEIKKNITDRYRIVTLDGDVVATSGAMTGGNYKKQNALMLKSKLNQIISNIESESKIIDSLQEKYNQVNDDLVEIESKITLFTNLENAQTSDITLYKSELKEAGVESSKDDKDIETNISELNDELSSINLTKTELELKIKSKTEIIDQTRLSLKEVNENLKVITQEEGENNVKSSRLEMDINAALETLREDYSLSHELAYEKAEKNIDLEQYKNDVVELKRKIRALGPINELAVEEFEELKEKFDFIDVQKEDLLEAKEKLEDIIFKLDNFFIESFEDTYIRLRQEFQLVFTELFGGGQADLVLTNPEDMLNTGVEIVAQPPGKKLQTISLLSGGEKALTAISLLFAILRIKTLPFAILDEVEAALDEVNVMRYAKYIKVFSERTQFIVITHRQGTMENVDSLYGVTMPEKGVSAMVKVSLAEGAKHVEEN